MPHWLVVSIVLSFVLTVVVNLFLWLFPAAGRGISDAAGRMAAGADRRNSDRADSSHVRVIVPWKAMVIGSVVLTVALNLLLVLTR